MMQNDCFHAIEHDSEDNGNPEWSGDDWPVA
jgi:hypothetical protein